MSSEPMVSYGGPVENGLMSVEELQASYEIVGRDKDGTILIRRKPNTDSKKQKAADGLAALFGLFF